MISLKNIRENKEQVSQRLETKNFDLSVVDTIINQDLKWRKGVAEVEKLKEERNSSSKKISINKKEKKPVDAIINEMQSVSSKIKEIDSENTDLKSEIDKLLLEIPNIPHTSVPLGKDETDNVVIRAWGEKREFDFNILSHINIADNLN